MKRTLDNIAYDLLTTVRQLHDDSDIDLRMIKQWIQNSRAVWLTNELNKFKPVSPEFIQDLGVCDLVPYMGDVCGVSGYTLLKTSLEMPAFLEAGQEPAITRVGPTVISSGTFKIIPYERAKYVGSGRFNGNAIYSFLLDRYIYVMSKTNSLEYAAMRRINTKGILSDPADAARFSNSDGTPCYTSNSYYPMTDRLVTYMKEMIIQSDIRTMLSLIPDKFNNASDDTAGQQSRGTQPSKQEDKG
jgi:hypothetical protein